MKAGVYARVSTLDQEPENEPAGLRLTPGRMDERIRRIEDHKGRTDRRTVSPMSRD